MSAWEDDVGSPSHHVMRSHTIAPTSPARITVASTMARSTSPFPIVLATAVPNTKTAMKLNVAAQTTAADGDRTRVETTVAMEFAASWRSEERRVGKEWWSGGGAGEEEKRNSSREVGDLG